MHESRAARVSRVLASPTGVRVAVPLLVLIIGLLVTLLGLGALGTESESMARDRLNDQVSFVSHDIGFALGQSDTLLARVRALALADSPSAAVKNVAPLLYDVVLDHAGVAFASISYPDGTFRAGYIDRETHALMMQESRVGKNGTTVVRYVMDGSSLHVAKQETTAYDPRERGFYSQAVAAHGRIWTEAYTFYKTHTTGITCAEPVYDVQGRLHAVITIDFDVHGLSEYISRVPFPGARTVVFTDAGAILAYSGSMTYTPMQEDRLLAHEDLHDTSVSALLQHRDSKTVDANGVRELAVVRSIDGASVPKGWHVASLVPESSVYGPLYILRRRSLLTSGVAVLIAALIGLALARNIVRMRRELKETEASLATARKEADELGSYRLVSLLGEGGMGEVWRAEHRLLAREAAIKLIRNKDPEGVAESRERFRREAQALASMQSRNTIALYDYGITQDGVFFYVMELLDGLDLESLVVEHGPQSAARVIHLMAQVCSSLMEAHEAGLLHRDIKPANLFICRVADEVDVIKVLDFGLVNVVGEKDVAVKISQDNRSNDSGKLTQEGLFVGTPAFMSPEQATAQLDIDGRADLYSLACVAWWLLTGTLVFDKKDVMQLLMAHMAEEIPKLESPNWMPPELRTLILACLAKAPADRPQTARALRDALLAIRIPDEHAWTPAKAITWWTANKPRVPKRTNPPSADGGRVIVARGSN